MNASMSASVAYAAASGSAMTTSRICSTPVSIVCRRLCKSSAEKESHVVLGSGNGQQRRVRPEVTQLLDGELLRRHDEDGAARRHVRDEGGGGER